MNFSQIIAQLDHLFKYAPKVQNKTWQSRDITNHPEMQTREILNHSFKLDLRQCGLTFYQSLINPNLPWADDHFENERVSGQPLNPGQEWENWPYAQSAATHKRDQFSHSYAERYWPRFAGQTEHGILNTQKSDLKALCPHHGIRYEYGDLGDLINLMASDPYTRQAYLPVWFPEDLWAANAKERVPCSLGYHFIIRDDKIHVVYYMRSCDYVRHFRDDVYLTVRLLMWVRDRLQVIPELNQLGLGSLTMHITSMHIFENDYNILFRNEKVD